MQMTESGDPYLTLLELLGLRWGAVADTAQQPVTTDAQNRTLRALESDQRGDVAKRPRNVLDEVIKYPFAVDELESYLRTLDAPDVDKQYLLYELLADAYVLHGRAAEEMRRRAAAVQSGQAGTKALTLWLSLAAQESPEKARDLVDEVERAGVMARLGSEYQRVLLARLYARAGFTGPAVDLYRAVLTSVLADASGTDTSVGYGWSADPYGRDNGLTLFTARGLYEEAQQHLDLGGLELFAGDLLALVRPRGPELEPVYAQLALMLQQQTLDAGQPVEAVQKVADALRVGVDWSRQDVLQATDARAQSGQVDEALTLLRTALKKELDLAKASPAAARMAQATRGYRVALGVGADLPLVNTPRAASGVEAFSSLFPARADAWPGADAWVSRAAREVPNWVEQRAVNRDAAVQVLSLLTLRLHQMGNVADAQDAVRHLGQLLRGGRVSVKAATLAVAVAQRAAAPIEFAVLKDLIRDSGISVGDIAAVVERTVQVEGPERAVELAELAATYTSDDALLSRLISIAHRVGGVAQAQGWIDRRNEAASARSSLKRKK